MKMRRLLREEIARVVSSVAQRVGIETALYPRRPDQLSAGQKQKVAVGRALAIPPKLFVLDEPMSQREVYARPANAFVRAFIRSFDFPPRPV